MSKLSILGMYNYDSSVFADFSVPEGLQKQNVIDAILLECSELELLYSSLNLMKIAIRTWTYREFPTWEKLQNTIDVEYNPIWNVDATITETGSNTRERSGSGSDNGTVSEERTVTEEGTVSDSGTASGNGTVSDNGTDTHSVKGYNSSNWSDSDKDTKASTQTITNSQTTTNEQTKDNEQTTISNQEMSNDQTWSDEESGSDTRSIRRTGNIGVTSTQQLIQQERDVALFNVTDYIVESFKKRFCLLVY